MSFGGSVLAMIQTIKANARPKRKAFDCWDKKTKRNTELIFKKVQVEELKKIKRRIRRESNISTMIEIGITLVILSILVFAWFYWVMPIIM